MKRIIVCSILSLMLVNAKAQTNNSAVETSELKNWDRKYFTKPLNKAFVFYFIYGNFSADFKIAPTYRTKGVPNGVDLEQYGPKIHPEVVTSMLSGYLWEDLKKKNPDLSKQISNSKECFIIKGELKDTSNLNYLRDIIGVVAYLLDNGGVGVLDPQSFTFFGKKDWNEKIFDPDGAVPRQHVMIVYSNEKGGKWYHTRGMRKYGRPDLSIHQVTPEYEKAVEEMINRFIEYEAFGGIIADKKEIKMNSLPPGMWCENKGDPDDPDFNNVHVEINWK